LERRIGNGDVCPLAAEEISVTREQQPPRVRLRGVDVPDKLLEFGADRVRAQHELRVVNESSCSNEANAGNGNDEQ
jgi:hypothetical protein